MKSSNLLILLFLLFLGPFSANAESFEILVQQSNPDGFAHKKTCVVKNSFCTQSIEVPIRVGESGMVIDVGIVIDVKQNSIKTVFKADQRYLSVYSDFYKPFSDLFDGKEFGPKVVNLYLLLDDDGQEKTAVLRSPKMHVADMEIAVRKKP